MEKVVAPIPGNIVSVAVKVGQTVKSGQKLLILEALKMQNEIFCETAGTVKEILVNVEFTIEKGPKGLQAADVRIV